LGDDESNLWGRSFIEEDQMFRIRILSVSAVPAALILGLLLFRPVEIKGAKTAGKAGTVERTPVLVELFTSEGCSDCPPADALLQKLDRSQPVSSADAIVLSEHVDYWNDIGWKDPYSSHLYSVRQGAYADQFGLSGVYTPQMVVDGRIQLVGSDERGALRAIEDAAKAEKISVSLSSIHFDGEKISLHLETGPLPSALKVGSANVLLAVADESDQSSVNSGENAGRNLRHVAVLRDLVRVGKLEQTGRFSEDVAIRVNHGRRGEQRVVAIIQEATAGRVLGVGSGRVSE
jgi:hypothetical protein